MNSSSSTRPGADAVKLMSHYDDWKSGEELPGRTLSYFKTGLLPDLLADSTDAKDERTASLAAVWEPWEKGKASPGDVMAGLERAGLREFLAAATE